LVSDYWAQGIDTKEIPLSILKEYNKQDVQITKMLFDVQQKLLSTKQKRLVWLLGEDLKALQEAEYAGIRFDSEKANKRLTEYKQAISIIERHLSEFLPDGIAKTCFNFDSGDHLSALLYGGIISFDWAQEENAVYKSGAKIGEAYVKRSWFKTDIDFPQRFRPLDGTEVKKTREDPTARTRFYQVDAPTLSQLKTRLKENRELLTLLKARAEKIKVVEMIETIYRTMEKKQWNDSYIHGQFNQNIVITGRLSSSAPNLQNTPPEVDELLITRY
jgi:DNA polymerase I-like protein with 3'-5' exonuclease and polymerase domains